MRSAVLLEPSAFELQDRPRPSPGPDDVLVDIRDVGTCGSHVHYYEHGRIADDVVHVAGLVDFESPLEDVDDAFQRAMAPDVVKSTMTLDDRYRPLPNSQYISRYSCDTYT